MTQTIMERVHGSSTMITLRSNSIRKNTLDTNNLSKSDLNLSRQKHKNQDKDNDNESTSSGSSRSTKSSQATVTSSSLTAGKSPTSGTNAAKSIRKQLKKLAVRNFLRREKNQKNDDHQDTADDDEDDHERILINDGSNGDLKYKASRYLKEQPQFDKTQLLQTIVNAHDGPIWCMK
jgi:hypothetical protein